MRSIAIFALAAALVPASAAAAQPTAQSHQEHQGSGRHQATANEARCCCEEKMRQMMMEMMQKHHSMSDPKSVNNADPNRAQPQQGHKH